MEKPIYFVSDKFIEKKNAHIHVNDIGLIRGYSVFDYLKTYFGKPFHLSDHIDRLFFSARSIGLQIPYTKDEISQIVKELIKANEFDESSIRLLVTGGIGRDSKSPGEPNLIVTCEPRNEIDKEFYNTGIKLKTVQGMRESPLAKTSNYILAVKYLNEFYPKGFFEILYIHNDSILECTSSNIFIICSRRDAFAKNRLITPKEDLLLGITRRVILQICEPFYEIEEREIKLSEALSADEVFITSTDKEVLPVVMIDKKKIGNGTVGENSKKIFKLFTNYIDSRVWMEI